MAIWPFGRKKRSRKPADDEAPPANLQRQLTRSQTSRKLPTSVSAPNDLSGATAKVSRNDSKRRKRDSAQTPDNNDVVEVPFGRQASTTHDPTSIHHTQPMDIVHPKNFVTPDMSQTSLARRNYEVPTLHNKRASTETNLLRRKSSKRKRNDPTREQEIRNMVISEDWKSSNRNIENRSSSFAAPEAPFARRLSESPDSRSFKVSAFEALTPRPLLRCTETPQYAIHSDAVRSPTPKQRSWNTLGGNSENDRVEDLADEMDASALRELMDRDRRRRASKQRDNQDDKSPKKLKKRNRQPLGESGVNTNQIANGPQFPSAGEAPSTIGQETAFTAVTETNHSDSWLRDPSKENLHPNAPPQAKQDIGDGTFLARASTDNDATDTKGTSQAPSAGPGRGESTKLRRSESRISQSAGRFGRSLTSLLRRSSLMKRESRTFAKEPSSFSVPSRESVSKVSQHEQMGPTPFPQRSALRLASDGQSTVSKFTEHFNDEPPVSEFQRASISQADMYPLTNRMSIGTGRGTVSAISTVATPEPQDNYRSGANSPDTRPNSLFLAQSLASIDSEGSWLSGKPSRRLSQAKLNQYRGSAGSTREKLDEPVDSVDDNATSEEFFGPLAVPEEEEELESESSGLPIEGKVKPSDEEGTTWHESVGRRPLLINPGSRAKSKEGLFTEFLETASDTHEVDAGDSPLYGDGEVDVRRATSVELGKGHARHISAGSAKLLELPSRQLDSRRPSAATGSSGILPSE